MISIIVPVYRSETTLERCIHSLTAQTCTDIEILMIADGPPDASGILADHLAEEDARIRVIHQKNQGVSVARNTGIEQARGELIQFVDSDDYVDPMLCEKLLKALEQEHADLAVCGFHHLYFGRDVVKLPGFQGSFQVRQEREKLLLLYERQFLNMPWNKLYKKEAIKECFRRDLDLGEDLLFNLGYLKHAEKVAVVNEALCYYIQDGAGNTLSTKKRKNRMENAFFLYQEFRRFMQELYSETATEGILEGKLVAEFLDEIEGLAFQNDLNKQEKEQVIHQYYEGYRTVSDCKDIRLKLADYRLLYYFFRRKQFRMVLFLTEIRGVLVKCFRRIVS